MQRRVVHLNEDVGQDKLDQDFQRMKEKEDVQSQSNVASTDGYISKVHFALQVMDVA